jgi:hypothetical protein
MCKRRIYEVSVGRAREREERKLPNTWREFRPSPTIWIVSVCCVSHETDKAASFYLEQISPNLGFKKRAYKINTHKEIFVMSAVYERLRSDLWLFRLFFDSASLTKCATTTSGKMICERATIFHIYGRMLINIIDVEILENWMNRNFGTSSH